MKVAILLISVIALGLVEGKSETEATCGGSCTHSIDCTIGAGDDSSCRCTYLTCMYSESRCGGGCMTNEQCYSWSGGDSSCVCTWWFECEDVAVLKNPGYKPFLKIAAMARARRHHP